eukprot:scaffold11797_cov123-Isochrysis_galbana.AAC.10
MRECERKCERAGVQEERGRRMGRLLLTRGVRPSPECLSGGVVYVDWIDLSGEGEKVEGWRIFLVSSMQYDWALGKCQGGKCVRVRLLFCIVCREGHVQRCKCVG